MLRSIPARRLLLAAAAVAPLTLGATAFAQSSVQTTSMSRSDAMAPAAKTGMSHDAGMRKSGKGDAMHHDAMGQNSMSHDAMSNQPHR